MSKGRTWSEIKADLRGKKKDDLIARGYSEIAAEEYLKNYEYGYEEGYFKGCLEASVAIAFNIMRLQGFPVEAYRIKRVMTHDEARKILQEYSTLAESLPAYSELYQRDPNGVSRDDTWKDIQNALSKNELVHLMGVITEARFADAIIVKTLLAMEDAFFKACIDCVIANTMMDLETKGFPIKHHIARVEMTIDEALEILHKKDE